METKNSINKQNPFEIYAQEYDDWFIKHEATFLSELLLINSLMPNTKNCLEVGTGTGRFAQALNIKKGVEPSIKMGEIAKKRGITIYQEEAENLHFKDNTFDCILMITSICFMNNPILALQESYRVLKNNGNLIIGFVDKNSNIGKTHLKNKDKNKFYKNANFYSTEEVIKMLSQSNFEIKQIKQTLFKNNTNETSIEQPKEGYDKGSFIGIKTQKIVL